MADVLLGGRYALESVLAQGGMATVWLARDEVLARPVAVKILHEHLAANTGFVERFQREALAAARLTHPNIVAIYDSGTEDGGQPKHYIVMEYCSGGTLAGVIPNRAGLTPGRVAAIGSEICDALDFAHTAGVVHRDLKPANVLIAEDELLKVGDFGIAKAAFATGDITTTGLILGTVAYVSPEQAQGAEPDARSDLYSLGILLYELLVGRPPFRADSAVATAMQHVQREPPAPRSMRAGIPRALDAAVLKALEKDPDVRFQTAAEMGAALRQAVGLRSGMPAGAGARSGTSAPAGTEVETPAGRDTRWTVGVVLLVIVAVALTLSLVRETTDRAGTEPRNTAGRIRVVDVSSFDPYGDGSEHEESTGFVTDGNLDSSWNTEQYEAPLAAITPPKAGVGLLFDLGRPTEVSTVEITSTTPGYGLELLASDVRGADVSDYESVQATSDADDDRQTLEFAPITARYWLLWCVELPPGLQLSITEVRFAS